MKYEIVIKYVESDSFSSSNACSEVPVIFPTRELAEDGVRHILQNIAFGTYLESLRSYALCQEKKAKLLEKPELFPWAATSNGKYADYTMQLFNGEAWVPVHIFWTGSMTRFESAEVREVMEDFTDDATRDFNYFASVLQ